MDSIVGAIKRFSLGTNHSKWSPQFTKLVDQIAQPRISAVTRVGYIRKIGPWIECATFTNSNDSELLKGKRDLLRLWEYMLEFVTFVSENKQKELGFNIIVAIVQREEFRLGRLGFGPTCSKPTCSEAHVRVAKVYKDLLVKTFLYVNKAMAKRGRNVELIHFAAQMLGILFFRLPVVGGRIVDALQAKVVTVGQPDMPMSPKPETRETGSRDHPKEDDSVKNSAGKEEEELGKRSESDSATDVIEDANSKNDAKNQKDDATDNVPVESKPCQRFDPESLNKLWRQSTKFDDGAEPRFIKENPDLFEWNYFYSNDDSEQVSLQHLVQSEDNSCMNWLTTKETFFLTFTEMFVLHIKVVATKPICWTVLPAYDILLQSFWGLLRSAIWWDGICKRVQGEGEGWVTSFPAYMRVKQTAIALLANKELLNPFVRLTYECTNMHSLLSIDSCVEHLNLWVTTVAEPVPNYAGNRKSNNAPPIGPGNSSVKAKMRLPSSFDYELFWFGMKQLLSSHLFQALLKTCSFLYNNFHLFRGDHRVSLTNHILTDFFFPLFLHWSSEVRTYFQHTMVYKMLRADRRYLPCFTDTQVMQTYGVIESGVRDLKGKDLERQSHRSRERRLGVLDEADVGHNDELLIDMAICSKIDSYIRLCLHGDESIPQECRVYVKPALVQYAELLHKYYRGVQLNSLESLPSLTHRMVLSDSNPYTH